MATLDLNLLPTFVAVAKAASFSGAARQLGVPKSSISRAIAALEAMMGVRLVHRTTRHVSLSTTGAALLERVAPLIDALTESIVELPELEDEPTGLLRITATVDFAATVLAPLVTRFLQRYPAVEVDLRLTSAVVDLTAEGIDLALRISSRPLDDSSLYAKRVGAIELQLYAAPDYLARRGVPRTPQELEGHDWVRMRGAEHVTLDGPRGAVKLRPSGRVTCDDMLFVHAAITQGLGIGVLPSFLVEEDLAAGRLVPVLPRLFTRSGVVWIVCPAARLVPRKVTAFRDFLIEAVGTRPFSKH